jgi:uncharacterized membrane protein YdjX (TVP38/TMEM64 family)
MTPIFNKPIYFLGIGVVGAIAWLFMTAPALAQTSPNFSNPQEFLRSSLTWIESLGFIGGAAFIGIYIIGTIAFIPATFLTLGAGVVFGVVLGSIYVFIGATLGAIAAFLIGRYLLRDWIGKKIESNEKFAAIDKAVAEDGFKIVLLTRLSPIFPFNLLNYAFGVTGVTFKDYTLGSVGMIPATVMYVYIGSLAGNIALIGGQTTNPTLQWLIQIGGFIATVVVTIYVTCIATQALAEIEK